MRYIKRFEGFSKEELDLMIKNHNCFAKKINRNLVVNETMNKLRNYDISNFTFEINYFIYIKPDKTFIDLYEKLCREKLSHFDPNLKFEISVVDSFYKTDRIPNLVDFMDGIPSILQGISLGYKIYRYLLHNVGYKFITTNRSNSDLAKNLWYSLLTGDDFYSGTNELYGVIINKNLSNEELSDVYNQLSNLNLKFDNDFNELLNIPLSFS